MANLITVVVVLLFDIACGCTFGWSWIWILATVIGVIDLVLNVYVYATTKPKITNSKMEEMRNIITNHCLTELGWEAVGSGIIGDNAVEVWCITPDGKKGKSCIYKIDADDVNCYVNVNNINWEEVK